MEDKFRIDPYEEKYAINGPSKANRFRAIIADLSPRRAAKVFRALWDHKNEESHQAIKLMSIQPEPDIEGIEIVQNTLAIERDEFEEIISKIEARGEDDKSDRAIEIDSHYDFDTVLDEIERATSFVNDDPEDAITASCSLIESVCRSILVELSLPLPRKMTITYLYESVKNL